MIDLAIESLAQRLGWPDVSERHPADLGVRVFEVHPGDESNRSTRVQLRANYRLSDVEVFEARPETLQHDLDRAFDKTVG